ncbi:MAG TPA: HAMP domain-containing sensor histidine kinase [Polyangiaceae bacterium]|nr:HAMP domain-containing sensor histidine kinase [Polyangiaceae bacterium]
MRFRERLVLAASLTSLIGLGAGFSFVYEKVCTEHEHEIDLVLGVESREEADEIARNQGARELPEDPDLKATNIGPLRKYAVLYDGEGRVLARSALVGSRAPELKTLNVHSAKAFDHSIGQTHVRAVLLPVPGRPGEQLLFGVSRDPLDSDAALLARVMSITFVGVVVWIVLMTWWLTTRMTREHEAIAAVARRVAAGDLSARVGGGVPHEDIARLGRDVDSMIEQLSALVTSQQKFVSYAAHELRSPLTAAYGELSNALRKERSAADYKEAIECALEATQHMRTLAEDLLVLARSGAGPASGARSSASLANVTRVAMAQLAGTFEARGVRVELEGDARVDTWNERDLQRLVVNLLDNAVKHSPRGGVVTVRAASKGEVELSVQDQGPGVPAADVPRIFEPFFRGSREASEDGSGLGLAIVRAIARAHNGEIRLEPSAESGCGARFTVRFGAPLARTP